MLSTKFRVTATLIMSMLCSACEQWPPSEVVLREHFEENRQSFSRLEKKIRDSDFSHVSRSFNSKFQATPVSGGYSDQFVLEDDVEWANLLDAVRMYAVHRNDNDVVSLDASVHFPDSDNRLGIIAYVRDPDLGNTGKRCQPEHEPIPCGYCVVPLGEDWYISYYWVQSVFDRDQYDAYLKGNLSLNDYQRGRETAAEQCRIEGAREMGYTVDNSPDEEL